MSAKIGRNDPCWCGSGKKYKERHAAFDDKIAHFAQLGHRVPTRDLIKTPDQIAGIKESAKINVAVLDYIEKNIHAGMNTAEVEHGYPDRHLYEHREASGHRRDTVA